MNGKKKMAVPGKKNVKEKTEKQKKKKKKKKEILEKNKQTERHSNRQRDRPIFFEKEGKPVQPRPPSSLVA